MVRSLASLASLALVALAATTASANDLESARAFARLAETDATLAPHAAVLYRRAAEGALADGRVEVALDAAMSATKLAPDDAETWAAAARIAASVGRAFTESRRSSTDIRLAYDDAARCARRARKLDPDTKTVHRVLADAALSRLDDSEAKAKAIAHLRAEVDRAPSDADSLWRLGELLFRHAGDYDAAARALAACVRADPSRIVAWKWLGTALEYGGNPERAAGAYLAALALDPFDRLAFDRLWRCALTTQTPEAYATAAANVERFAPTGGEPTAATLRFHRTHGWLLARAERHEAALRKSRDLLERFPDRRSVRSTHADVLLITGRTEEGVALFRRLVEENPNDAFAYGRLSRHGFEAQDFDLLRWLYEQRPDPSVANNIGFLHRDVTHDYEASRRWYLRACEGAPRNADILNDTGLIYQYHLHDFDRAIVFYDRAIAAVRSHHAAEIAGAEPYARALREGRPVRGYGDALENLALIHVAREQWSDARVRLEELLALQPERRLAQRLMEEVRANGSR